MTRLKGIFMATLLLGASMATQAGPITLNFTGNVTSATNLGPDSPAGVVPGAAFTLAVTYDTSAPLLAPCVAGAGGGCVGLYRGGSISFSLFLGPDCNPCGNDGHYVDGALGIASRLFVFDNFDASNDGISQAADGLIFTVIDSGLTRWRLALTSLDASIYSGTGLPASLDPRLAVGSLQVCSIAGATSPVGAQLACNEGDGHVEATVRAVPEPSTFVLMGLGLLGMAYTRRRLMSR